MSLWPLLLNTPGVCVHIPVCITCLHDDICYGFPKVLGMPQAIETCPQGFEGIPGMVVQMSGLCKYVTVSWVSSSVA